MKRIMSVVGLLLALSACHRTAPSGHGGEGAIVPIKALPSGTIAETDLTDPSALYAAFKKIEHDAPPQDMNNKASLDRWKAFVDSARQRAIGSGQYLLTASCGAQPGYETGNLSYSEENKNLHVRIYTITPAEKARAEAVVDLLRPVPAALIRTQIEAMLSGEIAALPLPYNDRNLTVVPSMDDLTEDDAREQTIPLLGGRTMTFMNEPIRELGSDLNLAMSNAAGAQQQMISDRLNGKSGNTETGAKYVSHAIEQWRNFPVNARREGSWADVPYVGDPAKVCLIVRVSEPDLTSGGRGGYVLIDPKADMISNVLGWYLVEKDSRKIVAQGSITKDVPDNELHDSNPPITPTVSTTTSSATAPEPPGQKLPPSFSFEYKLAGAEIIRSSGLGTAKASITGRVTEPMAREYCERDPGGDTVPHGGRLTVQQCITQEVRRGLRQTVSISADCSGETLVSQSKAYSVVLDDASSDRHWKEASTGEVLDGSGASGALELDDQFAHLCPRNAAVD